MSLEEQIKNIVEDTVKRVLSDFINDLRPKQPDSELLKTKEAAAALKCSDEYVRMLQNRGDLDLIFLPGSKRKVRRVLKSQVDERIEENRIKTGIKKKAHTK